MSERPNIPRTPLADLYRTPAKGELLNWKPIKTIEETKDMSEISKALYKRTHYQHTPRNVNVVHKEKHKTASLNQRIAVMLTNHVGTMWCSYLFAGIGIGSLVGVFTGNVFLALLFGSISSYFLQLVLLPVILTGQNVLSAHQELLAEEQFATTVKIYHDLEQAMQHLSVQDTELVKQTMMLVQLLQVQGASGSRLLEIASPAQEVTLETFGTTFSVENKAQQEKSA